MRVLHVVTGLSAAVVMLALNAPTGAFEPTAQAAWMIDFNQALRSAGQQGRPMLVHFHSNNCPPCRRMEHETLNSPEVLGMIRNTFVAVKVNVDLSPDIARRYGVESWPTDFVLAPNGGVIDSSNGYVTKGEFLAKVGPVEASYAAARRARQIPVAAAPQPRQPATAVTQKTEKLPPYPTEDPSVGPPSRQASPPQIVLHTAPPAQSSAAPALDGYCAVTLRQTRSWKKGTADYSLDHQGQTYHFLGATELATFKANPAKFAPRNLGCDPVVLSENDLAAPGTTKFGAYFDGELYLFKSADTRSRFRNDPLRYSRARHVLKPEDLQNRRI